MVGVLLLPLVMCTKRCEKADFNEKEHKIFAFSFISTDFAQSKLIVVFQGSSCFLSNAVVSLVLCALKRYVNRYAKRFWWFSLTILFFCFFHFSPVIFTYRAYSNLLKFVSFHIIFIRWRTTISSWALDMAAFFSYLYVCYASTLYSHSFRSFLTLTTIRFFSLFTLLFLYIIFFFFFFKSHLISAAALMMFYFFLCSFSLLIIFFVEISVENGYHIDGNKFNKLD